MDWIRSFFGGKNASDEIIPPQPVTAEEIPQRQPQPTVSPSPPKNEIIKIPKSSSIEIPGSFKLNDASSDEPTDNVGGISPPEKGFCFIENSPPVPSNVDAVTENIDENVTEQNITSAALDVEDVTAESDIPPMHLSDVDYLLKLSLMRDFYYGENGQIYETIFSNFSKIIEGAWAQSPESTINIVFSHCHNESSEEVFKHSFEWLMNEHPRVILENIKLFTMKNIWLLAGTRFEPEVIELYSRVLLKDIQKLNENAQGISLAALYAPTQQSSLDRKYKIVSKLIKEMGTSNKKYRTEILNPLRAHLKGESYTRE